MNMVAVSQALQLDSSMAAASVAADNVVGVLYLTFLALVPSLALFRRWFRNSTPSAGTSVAETASRETGQDQASIDLRHIAFALGLSFSICALGKVLAELCGIAGYSIMFITALTLAVAGAAIVIVYKGNVYAASKGVPFWNSPLLPVLYATYAIRGGLALLLVALPLSGGLADTRWMELIELWVAVSAAVMLGFYLSVMRDTSPAARRSVAELTGGRAALGFYLGTVGAGLVVPIVVGMAGTLGALPGLALAATGAFSLAGDFFAKYAIAKAGIYVPLMPAGRI